jgi:hypothetical protein
MQNTASCEARLFSIFLIALPGAYLEATVPNL